MSSQKWVKMTVPEITKECNDILHDIWTYESVEPYLDKFYKNKKTGKVKLKRK